MGFSRDGCFVMVVGKRDFVCFESVVCDLVFYGVDEKSLVVIIMRFRYFLFGNNFD